MLTRVIGAREAKVPEMIGREPELHSSAPQLDEESEVELED